MSWAFQGKAVITQQFQMTIRYMPDGSIQWSVAEPDTRKSAKQVSKRAKWRESSGGIMRSGTWDDFHNAQHYGTLKTNCSLGPVESVFSTVKYGCHLRDIELDRRREKKKKQVAQ